MDEVKEVKELNISQSRAIDAAMQNKNMFITGPGGTGKSFAINTIIKLKKSRGRNCITLAYTGSAAFNVNGSTIHKFIYLLKRGKKISELSHFYPENDDEDDRMILDTIIIDEISMCSLDLFEELDKQLKIYYEKDIPFAGIQIIAVGDFFQLPPIKSKFVFESELWDNTIQSSNYYFLEANIRHKVDTKFQTFLERLRVGNQTEEDNQIFQSLLHNKKEYRDGVIKLFLRNDDIDNYNQIELFNKYKRKDINYFEAGCEIIKGNFQDEEIQKLFNGLRGIDRELKLAIGCPVIVTKNLNVNRGVTNGLRAIVKDIRKDGVIIEYGDKTTFLVESQTYSQKSIPLKICKFILTKGVRKGQQCGKNNCKAHHGKYKETEWQNIIVEEDCDDIEDDEEVKRIIEIYQYPLKLGYAMSIHKSQGKTLEAADIFLSSWLRYHQSPGLVYVALSRCRNLEGIRLFIDYPKQINFFNIIPNLKILCKFSNAKTGKCQACEEENEFSTYVNICNKCSEIPIRNYHNYNFMDWKLRRIPINLEPIIKANFIDRQLIEFEIGTRGYNFKKFIDG